MVGTNAISYLQESRVVVRRRPRVVTRVGGVQARGVVQPRPRRRFSLQTKLGVEVVEGVAAADEGVPRRVVDDDQLQGGGVAGVTEDEEVGGRGGGTKGEGGEGESEDEEQTGEGKGHAWDVRSYLEEKLAC